MNAFRWLLPSSLGRTLITDHAEDRLEWPDVYVALRRHAGTGGAESRRFSQPLEGCRVLSAYHDRRGERFWIITEADHSSTMVLLPEEYASARDGVPIVRPVE